MSESAKRRFDYQRVLIPLRRTGTCCEITRNDRQLPIRPSAPVNYGKAVRLLHALETTCPSYPRFKLLGVIAAGFVNHNQCQSFSVLQKKQKPCPEVMVAKNK